MKLEQDVNDLTVGSCWSGWNLFLSPSLALQPFSVSLLNNESEGSHCPTFVTFLFFGGYLQNQGNEICKMASYTQQLLKQNYSLRNGTKEERPQSIVNCRIPFSGAFRKTTAGKR